MSRPIILEELHAHHATKWNDRTLMNALQDIGLISDLSVTTDDLSDKDLIRALNAARLSQAKANL